MGAIWAAIWFWWFRDTLGVKLHKRNAEAISASGDNFRKAANNKSLGGRFSCRAISRHYLSVLRLQFYVVYLLHLAVAILESTLRYDDHCRGPVLKHSAALWGVSNMEGRYRRR
jgi:hypothetical protein